MFKNILIGVDGSEHGRDAVALATRLAAADASLTLGHVHSGALRPSTAITPGLAREEHADADALLAAERAATGAEAALANIVAPTPGRGLHEQAERQNADLIVVGSCSRGLMGCTLIGNDTRAALNGAPCAVAVAARGYAEHPVPFAKVGVGYDGSPESKAALAAAREIAGTNHATLYALDVVSIPAYIYNGFTPVAALTIGELLDEAIALMTALDGVEGRAVQGIASEELGVFSADMDLLVVGSRGYGPLKRLVLGSTSAALQRHARCSRPVFLRAAMRAAQPEHAVS